MSNNGTLIGVSIGPGDINLLTVKALDNLKSASVIAYIQAEGKAPLALNMVRDVLDKKAQFIAVIVPMAANEAARRTAYEKMEPEFRKVLDAGQDIYFICEGDSLLYGSFQYMLSLLSLNYKTQIIPGITSVSASAAALQRPLVKGDETFQILPATLNNGALSARLSTTDGAVSILKVGRHVGRIKSILSALGRLDGAMLVEKVTWDDQRIIPLSEFSGDAAYFSQILIPPHTPQIDAPAGAAIVCLNQAGMEMAQRLRAQLPGAVVYGRKGRLDTTAVDHVFDNATETLQSLYKATTPIIAIMASGIVIRALAPQLNDKRSEPPVVAMSPDGGFCVPLLGGHGGANRLARAASQISNGFAAITTAGDSVLGLALDEPPVGWSIENAPAAKSIVAKRLAGGDVGVQIESGDGAWLTGFATGNDILVTHDAVDTAETPEQVILHPPTLSLGVGCERDCDPSELWDLVIETLETSKLSPKSIACVASIDVKSNEPAVLVVAERLGVPARFFTADDLSLQTPRLKNPSDIVNSEVGCPGVSEGAALAVVGDAGSLLVQKHKSKRATCAIGLSPTDIDPYLVGKGRGRLYILGIGPGTDSWRTPEVTRVLSAVTDVVGYGFYLDLVPDLIKGKTHHTSNLAQEEERVRHSLDLAAQGKDVALISSGDVGIYAMASLAFELLDRENRPEWNRLYIQVEPGISAFQAAAARVGAPVGHDFCLISLSDLLTPWAVIERRLKAAAEGGFVVSFYNPVSKRRRTQLAEARDILLTHRRPDTPVILARQLGRADEDIKIVNLVDLTPDMADMLTLVMVGGEDTRKIERGENTWVYTPRGYGGKMDAKEKGDVK